MTATPEQTNLGKMLQAYEQKYDLQAVAVADQIGIGSSTYSRIKRGKSPDAENLVKILTWMLSTGAG